MYTTISIKYNLITFIIDRRFICENCSYLIIASYYMNMNRIL